MTAVADIGRRMDDDSLSTFLGVLAASRRRDVCRYFAGSDGTVTDLAELVEFVVRKERRRPGERPASHRKTVELELYHVHLPVLAESGLVEFDPRSKTVRYRSDPDLERLLRGLSNDLSTHP